MSRTLRTPQALVVLGLSLVAGTGIGVAGHALTDATSPQPGGSNAGNSTGAEPTVNNSGLLGAGNLLATGDFERVGWQDVVVDVESSGDPQFLYSCARTQLSQTGYPTATISASWDRGERLSAAQSVAQLGGSEQATSLYALVTRWYKRCMPGGRGSGPVTPSTLLDAVSTTRGTARIWRIGGTGDTSPAYAVLARDGDRLGLIDVYSDVTPPDPAGLRALAQVAIDRLG